MRFETQQWRLINKTISSSHNRHNSRHTCQPMKLARRNSASPLTLHCSAVVVMKLCERLRPGVTKSTIFLESSLINRKPCMIRTALGLYHLLYMAHDSIWQMGILVRTFLVLRRHDEVTSSSIHFRPRVYSSPTLKKNITTVDARK